MMLNLLDIRRLPFAAFDHMIPAISVPFVERFESEGSGRPDDAPRTGPGEMRADHDRPLIPAPRQGRLAGGERHVRIRITERADAGIQDLQRMMEDVAGEQGALVSIRYPDHEMAGRVAGSFFEPDRGVAVRGQH